MQVNSPAEGLFFDVNAKLEEQKKTGDMVTLGFSLDINTKPTLVRYTTAGSVTLEGASADIKKKLEVNPKTQIPQILFAVYQHVFNAIYMLSSILGTPYPPPDLLHPMAEKIQVLSVDEFSKQTLTDDLQQSQLQNPTISSNAPTATGMSSKPENNDQGS